LRRPAVEYEPRLVEEAVVAALRRHPAEPRFRLSRDAAYAVPDPEARETRFRAIHAAWFRRLRLDRPVIDALQEQPAVARDASRCLAVSVTSPEDERAELFVADGPGAIARTVVLGLRPGTFADPGRLRALCRREFLHVADLLDPSFGYQPRPPGPGGREVPESLFRERYRALWGASVDGRLARQGWGPPDRLDRSARDVALSMPGPSTEGVFRRLFDGPRPTHAELVRLATAPES
jgi:hypothetical protein